MTNRRTGRHPAPAGLDQVLRAFRGDTMTDTAQQAIDKLRSSIAAQGGADVERTVLKSIVADETVPESIRLVAAAALDQVVREAIS